MSDVNEWAKGLVDKALEPYREEIRRLRAQVKHWEDKEVARASECCGQQERAEAAELQRDTLNADLAEARKAALRFYRDDGTFEVLASPEEVVERRKEAARLLSEARKECAGLREALRTIAPKDRPEPEYDDGEACCAECHTPLQTIDGLDPAPECWPCSTTLLRRAREVARTALAASPRETAPAAATETPAEQEERHRRDGHALHEAMHEVAAPHNPQNEE